MRGMKGVHIGRDLETGIGEEEYAAAQPIHLLTETQRLVQLECSKRQVGSICSGNEKWLIKTLEHVCSFLLLGLTLGTLYSRTAIPVQTE